MPPLPVVPGVMKLVIGGTYHDTAWLNIWHVHYSGSQPSSSNIGSYLTAIKSSIDTAYSEQMSADNEVTSILGLDLASDTGAQAEASDSTFGTRSGDFVPASVAMVVSCEINRRYRGGHPRKYLPWGTAGTYATGSTKDWDSGFVASCQSSLEDMIASWTGITEGATTWDDVVSVSYRSGGAVRATAVVDPITNYIVRTRICSQRRRLGKVGG